MLVALAISNVAIAILCILLARRIVSFHRQVTQLNRDLNRWTVLAESTLAERTLSVTQQRAQLRQWQLMHLRWQLQQRRLVQTAKFLRLVWLISKRRPR